MKYASLRRGLQLAICPSISGGGGIVPDLSGRGSHGTLNNMDATAYKARSQGLVLDFDGVDDFLAIGSQNLLRFPQTITAWCFRRSSGTNHTIIDGATDISFSFGSHLRFTSTNKLRYYFNNASGAFVDTSSTPALNTWNFIACTFDGTATRIYLNGILEGSATGDSFGTAIGSYRIGRLSAVYGATLMPLDGLIDDLRIYTRNLTLPEMALLRAEPGIGLRPERTSVFFGAQLFQAAWLAQNRNIIGGGVC